MTDDPFRSPAPWRHQFDNARDPYTARNALGIPQSVIDGGGGGGGGAPTDAEYIVAAADPTLTAERVLTNTATITWDFTTPGQAKASAAAGGVQFTAATTAPVSPTAGDFWYDLTTSILAIYINDGTSSQWVQVSYPTASAALSPPLDAVASVTGAWSLSRDMLTAFAGGTRYTKTGTAITTLEDQSGNNRDFTDGGLSARRPTEATAFPSSVLCADFAGSATNVMLNVALSNFIAASSGAVVVSVIVDAISSNGVTSYSNDGIIADQSVYMGLFARNLSGVTFYAYNWDGSEDAPSTTGTVGTACVLMWRHHGGNQYISINGGTEVSVASGNTQVLTGLLVLGGNNSGSACNCKIAEAFTTSDGSQTAALATAIANMKTYIGL